MFDLFISPPNQLKLCDPPIDTEDEKLDSKEKYEMNDRPSHSFHMNIRSKSPSPVR